MARGRHYRIERRLDTRRLKPANIIVFALVLLFVIAALVFFVLWKSKGDTTVDTSKNRPIASQVQSSSASFTVFEEPEYKISLPSSWAEQKKRQDQYYDYVVYGIEGEALTGRSLTVYRNSNRDVPAVTKIVPITVVENSIRTDGISGSCYKFTDLTETQLDEPAPSKWNEVNFMCNPNKIWNQIGVGSKEDGAGVTLKGRYFYFVFIDHSAKPDNSIFIDALKTFEAR